MARSSFKSQGTANNNALDLLGIKKEPEENLWTAVLTKALDDALYSSDYREAKIAISWVEGCSLDFRFVCHLANRDAAYVVRKTKQQIEKRKEEIKEFEEGIKRNLDSGLKLKHIKLMMLRRVHSKKGRKHKGGYHSVKRKWNYIAHPGQKTVL